MKQKCKVVMLPTNEEAISFSQICIDRDDNSMFVSRINTNINDFPNFVPQHLYIVSNDEIKKGDYYLSFDTEGQIYHEKPVKAWCPKPFSNHCKKIIATTNHLISKPVQYDIENREAYPRPSNEFIKQFCEKGGIFEVMVEYVDNGSEEWYGDDHNGEPIWVEN
jgi:hypothetical protein